MRNIVIGLLAEPRHRLGVILILRHPVTVDIHQAELVLSLAVPVFRRLAKHPRGVLEVWFATLAVVRTSALLRKLLQGLIQAPISCIIIVALARRPSQPRPRGNNTSRESAALERVHHLRLLPRHRLISFRHRTGRFVVVFQRGVCLSGVRRGWAVTRKAFESLPTFFLFN